MLKLSYLQPDGAIREVEAAAGTSVMQAAVDAGVAGIEGECGGAGACATCHVYIPAEWQALTGPASEDEKAMLTFGVDPDERSRLGCQIKLAPALDGLRVLTPRSQR